MANNLKSINSRADLRAGLTMGISVPENDVEFVQKLSLWLWIIETWLKLEKTENLGFADDKLS